MPERPILPPRLRRGDTIGLVCPAGPVREVARLQAGIRLIVDQGFAVKLSGPVEPREGYLADTDEQRAAHLHRLWADEEVRAILAVRGGYGCLRLAGLLDWELLARTPKWLIGFSDVTLLLNTLFHRCGLVSVHGPVATSLAKSDARSQASLFTLLTGTVEERIRPHQAPAERTNHLIATNVFLRQEGRWYLAEHHGSLPLIRPPRREVEPEKPRLH